MAKGKRILSLGLSVTTPIVMIDLDPIGTLSKFCHMHGQSGFKIDSLFPTPNKRLFTFCS